MMSVIYKEFYNKDRALPEPLWGKKCPQFHGVALRCPPCGSRRIFYSAHPDDPEEIFPSTVRCKRCGHITDWYEAYKQGFYHKSGKLLEVVKGDVLVERVKPE